MNHNNHHDEMKPVNRYSIKDFLPLIIIVSIISVFTLLMRSYYGWNIKETMLDFMAGFFLVFGFFKVINLNGFAEAYSSYDIIAKRSRVYAYVYPFIELGLGITYLTRYQLLAANWVTVIIMTIGAIGVAIELSKGRQIACACLGVVFKIPMTYVTLAEDVIMGLMAFGMLLQHYYV